jgi:hypothetical protein
MPERKDEAAAVLSGMIREPLDGKECVIPIEDRQFKSWLCSPKTLLEKNRQEDGE